MRKQKIKISNFDASRFLSSEESIAEYLKACLEEGGYELFVQALGDAAKARGMTQLAKEAGVGRESLYKSLAPGGNPSFKTVYKIASALGLSFNIIPNSSDHHLAPSG
ncbi:MAG: putative addiction module antidote protein [Candidatus Adiutrix sp.]|jgi:probable addiction module antidote protein|nr:putative addiction module antidote protein [Candidatus Adiutrix sp.]